MKKDLPKINNLNDMFPLLYNVNSERHDDEFYKKENILPRINYAVDNLDNIFKKSTDTNRAYICFVLIIRIKELLYDYEDYKRALSFKKEFVSNIITSFHKDNHKLQYLDIPFIFIEAILQVRVNGTFDDDMYCLLKKLFTENHEIFDFISENYKVHSIDEITYTIDYNRQDFINVLILFCKTLYINNEVNLSEKMLLFTTKNLYAYYSILFDIKYDSYLYEDALSKFNELLNIQEDISPIIKAMVEFYIQSLSILSKYSNQEDDYFLNSEDIEILRTKFIDFMNKLKSNFLNNHESNIKELISSFISFKDNIKSESSTIIYKTLIDILNKYSLPNYKSKLLNSFVLNKESIIDLMTLKEYKRISQIYSLTDNKENLKRYYFEIAYSLEHCRKHAEAKKLYEYLLKNNESSAVHNNLGIIYENYDKDLTKALESYKKALLLDPDDEIATRNLKRVETSIKDLKERPKKLKKLYFQKTEPWHKKLLFAIFKLSDNNNISIDDLSSATSMTSDNIKKNLSYLENLEMISINDNNIVIDTTIETLISEYINPKLERQIIKVDNSKYYRPIFYHDSEILLYRALLELFPQHLVFPNISLKTIFDIDKMRDQLDEDTLNYLYMAHVDYAIINTSSYFPVLAFEKDSDYNDNNYTKLLLQKKNNIFRIGGIPLLRVRYNSGLDYEKLKEEIKNSTKSLILEYSQDNTLSAFNLSDEFDSKKFGIMKSPIDLNLIRESWHSIVGKAIYQKSKIIDIEDTTLIIDLSEELKPIIQISESTIKEKLMEKYSLLTEIVFRWY